MPGLALAWFWARSHWSAWVLWIDRDGDHPRRHIDLTAARDLKRAKSDINIWLSEDNWYRVDE